MEELETGLSANQIWKESGTTLSFKDWIQREKDKGVLIPNKLVADTTATIKKQLGISDNSNSYVVTPQNTNTILGLNKWVLLSSLVVIGGAIAFSIYQKNKK